MRNKLQLHTDNEIGVSKEGDMEAINRTFFAMKKRRIFPKFEESENKSDRQKGLNV